MDNKLIEIAKEQCEIFPEDSYMGKYLRETIKMLQAEPCEDTVSRAELLKIYEDGFVELQKIKHLKDIKGANDRQLGVNWCINTLKELPPVKPTQNWIPVSEKYEHHIDHTDCIWYGNDCGCPVTCSQYRDGWNDAMDYIFKNGDGYRPYRRNENG